MLYKWHCLPSYINKHALIMQKRRLSDVKRFFIWHSIYLFTEKYTFSLYDKALIQWKAFWSRLLLTITNKVFCIPSAKINKFLFNCLPTIWRYCAFLRTRERIESGIIPFGDGPRVVGTTICSLSYTSTEDTFLQDFLEEVFFSVLHA